MEHKVCAKCKVSKLAIEFPKRKGEALYSYCKQCTKLWRQANKEKLSLMKKEYYSRPEVRSKREEYKKEYYIKHKENLQVQFRDYYSKPENRAKKLLFKAKERAKMDNLEFNLEISDIIIPTHCPYLGIELTHSYGQGQLESNSSIDRIDSTKGYVKGNIQIISRKANTMKSNADIETLKRFAKGVNDVHGI